MGKYSKKTRVQPKVLTIAIVALGVVLALLIAVLVHLNNKTPEKLEPDMMEGAAAETTEMRELLVESVTEQGDVVLVTTTYGTLKYPYAFSDIMSVEAETFEDHAVLEFSAVIADTTYKAYTLYFNGEEGMPVGTLQMDGETYVIKSQFHDMGDMSDESMITFYAAQETFNDVVNSLSENEGFTAAD